MNFKLYKIRVDMRKYLIDFWYFLMKPIAYFFTTEKINKRYAKKKAKITEAQAVQWMAEDIVQYMIKHKSKETFFICDYASKDDFGNGYTLSSAYYLFKRAKTKMAFYKFKIDADFQEKVIEYIRSLNLVNIKEEIETFSWQHIKNYKKTVHLLLR